MTQCCLDLFAFRLNVPLMCCFNLRLFTRQRRQSTIDFHHADQSADPVDAHDHGEAGKGSLEVAGGHVAVGGLSTARPAVSRVLRVEPLTHIVMTSPGWRTLLITWNDHMQSWIKTGRPIQSKSSQVKLPLIFEQCQSHQ